MVGVLVGVIVGSTGVLLGVLVGVGVGADVCAPAIKVTNDTLRTSSSARLSAGNIRIAIFVIVVMILPHLDFVPYDEAYAHLSYQGIVRRAQVAGRNRTKISASDALVFAHTS